MALAWRRGRVRVAGSSWHSVRGQALREAVDVPPDEHAVESGTAIGLAELTYRRQQRRRSRSALHGGHRQRQLSGLGTRAAASFSLS